MKTIFALLTLLTILTMNGTYCMGSEIEEDKAIHCILGEVRGEYAQYGYTSFLASAEALRNRNTTKGVYGCNAQFEGEMPYIISKGLVEEAKRAWYASRTSQMTQGATFWGSTITDKVWIVQMQRKGYKRTLTVGHTEYYKKRV